MTANASGVINKPKEIQNQQTTSSNQDDSHIICGQLITQPSWLSTDIHVKGNLIFEAPYSLPPPIYIQSQDQSCNVYCQDQNIVSLSSQAFDLNGIPSSQYHISYGQAGSNNAAQFMYHIPFPDADINNPDFDLKMWGFSDFYEWYSNDQLNPPDSQFLTKDGDSFRLAYNAGYMCEITITWQLRYTFDGTQPDCYVCCGLLNRDTQQIVPQSLQWYTPNGIKHKYLTMKTTFNMRCDQSQQPYFPFFQQQDGGGYNQFQNTEINGLCRSSILFKFYQFIQY